MFPSKIYFLRDDCEAELLKVKKENKIETGIYKYSKAKAFLGTEINFTMDRINEMKSKLIINF